MTTTPTRPRPALERRRFTVTDLQRMADAGVFADDERLELIEGEVVTMPLPGPRHAAQVGLLTRRLGRCLSDDCLLWVQNPVQLDDYSLLEPDVCILRASEAQLIKRYPSPREVLLAIEVADTTLHRDRRIKAPLYARAGVQQLWIFELPRRLVHVLAEPSLAGYRTARRSAATATLAVPGDGALTVESLLL